MLFDKGSTVFTTNAQLVIFIGLQGSGKTMFFNTHFAATHVHVSKDNFRNSKNRITFDGVNRMPPDAP